MGLKATLQPRSPRVPAAAGGEGETESAAGAGGCRDGGGLQAGAHCFFSRVVMVTSCLAALAMS